MDTPLQFFNNYKVENALEQSLMRRESFLRWCMNPRFRLRRGLHFVLERVNQGQNFEIMCFKMQSKLK
jgi:hypothetical protein